MKPMTALFAAALLAVPALCSAAAPAPKKQEKATSPAQAKPAEAKPAEEKAGADTDEVKQGMEAMGAALGEALKAAMAAPKGANDCESAFNGVSAMASAMEKAMGKGQAKGEMPSKEKFVKACAELPADVQKCLVIGYAMTHEAECAEAQNKLDSKTKEKMKAMLQ